MSFLNKIFGEGAATCNVSKMNWIALESMSQLNDIVTLSNEKTVLIFKHSTRCSVSRMVLKQFEDEFKLEESIAPYFLDLLEHRDISNAIASCFEVQHQSPQLLVIQAGKAVYSASHENINAGSLKMFS
jgi:bacillithiol system protein YtxJ